MTVKKNNLYGEKKQANMINSNKLFTYSNNYYLFVECLKLSDSKLMISAKSIVFCIKKNVNTNEKVVMTLKLVHSG